MNDLSQRLKDIVPTPPDPTDLSGIATRSAADGRRRRTQRRFAAVASVVVLAAGGVVLPRVLDDGPPDVAEHSEPQCVASPDAPLEEIETQEATWVRFCEPAEEGATRQVRFQRGVVTGGLATAVVQSWADRVVDRTCGPETPPVPSRLFRIQIGLADGSVTEIAGDTSCVDDHLLFLNMETPLLLQGGIRKDEVVQPRQVTCPDGLTTTETNWDGADAGELREDPGSPAIATTPLMPGQISAVDVCAYTGEGERRTFLEQWRSRSASNILSDATTGYQDGMADCEPQPDATSYVVVMQDFKGTARTFSLDVAACGAMSAAIGTPPVETYLGLASPELVKEVQRSKP